MNLHLAYGAPSSIETTSRTSAIRLQSSLTREEVAFDAALLDPIPFREAISALHDVVSTDLRHKPRDKDQAAYEEWKKSQRQREQQVRSDARAHALSEATRRAGGVDMAALERRYNGARNRYWKARRKYSDYLLLHDRELWRYLMPCDPVVTVADDVVFYECFSGDESTYGCLTVPRESFGPSAEVQLGTTNVDFSQELFERFQDLRSYRETRFRVAPSGVGLQGGGPDYFEEKIDLPDTWLRGFLQVQVAMGLPMRRVTISRDSMYGILSHLRRHKERQSPRALRFELKPGQPPEMVLEPWELRVVSHGTRYEGPASYSLRVWGKRRLLAFARILPLVDRFDVYLLGTGLPSFWVAHMGPMRLTLGLSGWTANDWTRGSAMDLILPPQKPSPEQMGTVARVLQEERRADLALITRRTALDPASAAAALHGLAHRGQSIFDLHAGVHRWRSILPVAVAEDQLGPPNPEDLASRSLIAQRQVKLTAQRDLPGVGTLIQGTAQSKEIELLLDPDGLIKSGKCDCSHHFRNGLRMGPCRHLLALRAVQARQAEEPSTLSAWYDRLRRQAGID